MNQRPLQTGKKYFLKHTTQTVQAVVTAVENKINFDTLEPEPARHAGDERHRRHPPQDRQAAGVRRLRPTA